MKRLDRMSSIFCLLLGTSVVIRGFQLKLKVGKDMGPGLLPAVVGGILVFLSVTLLMRTILTEKPSKKEAPFWVNPTGWRLVIVTLVASAAYPFFLHYLGFLLSNFLLIFFLFLVIARLDWWKAGAGGLASAFAGQFIFVVWLKVPFPHGLIGF